MGFMSSLFFFEANAHVASHHFAIWEHEGQDEVYGGGVLGGRGEVDDLSWDSGSRKLRHGVMKWTL